MFQHVRLIVFPLVAGIVSIETIRADDKTASPVVACAAAMENYFENQVWAKQIYDLADQGRSVAQIEETPAVENSSRGAPRIVQFLEVPGAGLTGGRMELCALCVQELQQ